MFRNGKISETCILGATSILGAMHCTKNKKLASLSKKQSTPKEVNDYRVPIINLSSLILSNEEEELSFHLLQEGV